MQKQTKPLPGLLSAPLFIIIMSNTYAMESVSSYEQSLDAENMPLKLIQAENIYAEKSEVIDMQTLKNELKTRGWDIQQNTSGSLILLPQKPSTSKAGTAKSINNQWQQLQKKFQNAGWSATLDDDGALQLTPPKSTSVVTQPEASPPVKSIEDKSFKDMQRKLKESGWNVTSNSDGSMLLYPPQSYLTSEVISKTPYSCPGIKPTINVSLPVDSWQKAHDIAQGWLAKESIINKTLSHSIVGKIRKIFNVYIISIVSNKAPFALMHQIAIKNSNGAIIILN